MLSVVIVICVLPAPFGEDRWRVLCLWIVYRSRSTGCIQWHKPVSSAGSQSGCWVITCYCGHAFLAWQHSPSAEEGSWNSCALVKLRMVPAVFRQLCLSSGSSADFTVSVPDFTPACYVRMVPAVLRQLWLSSDRFKCWFHGQRTRLYPCLLRADGASSLETALTVLRQVQVLISRSAYQTLPLLVMCGWCQQSWDSFDCPQTGSSADFTVSVPDFTPACCVWMVPAVLRQLWLSSDRFRCWFHGQLTRLYPCLLCVDGASSLETALSVLRQVHVLISQSAYQTLPLLVMCGWCQQSWDSFDCPQTGSSADFTVSVPDFTPACCVWMVPAVLRQLCPSSDRFTCWFHSRRTRLYPCLLCADGASSLETALTVLRQVQVLISRSAYQTLPLLVVCGWCQQSWDSFDCPQTGSGADFTVSLPDFTPACCVWMVPAVLRQLCPSSDRFTCWFHSRRTRLYPCLLCADGASSLETALTVLRQVQVLISRSAYQTLPLLVVCGWCQQSWDSFVRPQTGSRADFTVGVPDFTPACCVWMVPAVLRQLCPSSDRFTCWFHGQRTRLYPCLLRVDGASSLETALSVLRQVHVLISRSAYQTLPLLVVWGWCQQSWDSFVRPQTGSRADFTVGVPDFTPACCVRMVPAVLRQLCPSSDRFTCWFHGRRTRLYPCLLCADGASSLETALSVLRQVHVLISRSAYQTLPLLVMCLSFRLFEIPWESEQLKLVSVLCLTLVKFVTLFWSWSLVCWIASTLFIRFDAHSDAWQPRQ